MKNMTRVALDAMGGDYAPVEMVKGAIQAANENKLIEVTLVGDETLINEELNKYKYNDTQIKVIHASEKISTSESPAIAIKEKKDSSIVKGMKLVKEEKVDAFVSAGNSGAVLVGGQIITGKVRGVRRPALAPLIPTKTGISLLIDCGASVDAKATDLVQFAKMGSIYMESIIGIKNPKVGIVNIGAEEEKGNALVKESFPLLKACKNINFVGSVEARDIPHGAVDVIVCEAFVGNCILKTYEGVGSVLLGKIKEGMMDTVVSKVGALLVKSGMKKALKDFDLSEYGGAPLLGAKGLVLKTHGNAKAREVKNTILQCITFKEQEINQKIQEQL